MKNRVRLLFTVSGLAGCACSYWFNPFLHFSSLNAMLSIISVILVIFIYPKIVDWRYKYLFKHWYNVNEASSKYNNWIDIQEIILNEPLKLTSKIRTQNIAREIFYIFPLIVIIPTLNIVIGFVIEEVKIQSLHIGFEGSTITVIVAIITAITSFYYNSRLTARVKSRIEWVNELRNTISDFLSTIERSSEKRKMYYDIVPIKWEKARKITNNNELHSEETTESEELQSSFKIMSKIELMLNPSEKLHRTLVALLHLSFKIANIDVDNYVFEKLGYIKYTGTKHSINDKAAKAIWPNDSKPTAIVFTPDNNKVLLYDTLISHIFRVATAILKSEWERAKDIQ